MAALSNNIDIKLLKAELSRLENERLRIEQIPNQQLRTERSKDLARTILSFAAAHPEIREESRSLRDYAFQVLEFEKICSICHEEWKETASKIVALSCGHIFCSACQSETPKKCAICRAPSSRINTAKIIDAVLQAQCLNAMNPEALEVEEKKVPQDLDEQELQVPNAEEQQELMEELRGIRRNTRPPILLLAGIAAAFGIGIPIFDNNRYISELNFPYFVILFAINLTILMKYFR